MESKECSEGDFAFLSLYKSAWDDSCCPSRSLDEFNFVDANWLAVYPRGIVNLHSDEDSEIVENVENGLRYAVVSKKLLMNLQTAKNKIMCL